MLNLEYYLNAIRTRVETRSALRKDCIVPGRVVVLESDDWGSIRMPSTDTLHELKSHGYKFFEENGYDYYDTLASNDDLSVLIETLSSVEDALGNPAKLTMNCVVANPDFKKIQESEFQEYHYELFTETLKRYPNHDSSLKLWHEGMKQCVFRPQFHGREHLNVQMWLKLLQKRYAPIRDSFDKNVFSTKVDFNVDTRLHCLSAYNVATEDEYSFVKHSVRDGLDIFEKIFKYRPTSMIAPNYTWDTAIEDIAYLCGVKYLQGSRIQRHSQYVMNNGGKYQVRYMGQQNENGQIYLVRNCSFEPSENPKKDADYCMAQIDKAFKRNNAAIISIHRQNFIGGLHKKNRDNNLQQLNLLLSTIVRRYPDVSFLSSDELGLLIEITNNENCF